MSIQKLVIAALLGLCLLVPGVFAGTVTQVCSPVISPTVIAYVDDCTINPFNPALGTLDSVTLQLSGVSGTVKPQQTNIGGTPLTFSNSIAALSLTFSETGIGALPLVTVSQTSAPCADTVDPNSVYTGCASTPFSALSSSSVSDPNLAYYEVGGLVTLAGSGDLASASGSGGPGSGGFLYFGGNGTIGGELDVTYNYTAGTPEPTSMALLGAGLIGLAALARKRRA